MANPIMNRRSNPADDGPKLPDTDDIEGMESVCREWNFMMTQRGLSRRYGVYRYLGSPPRGHITFSE